MHHPLFTAADGSGGGYRFGPLPLKTAEKEAKEPALVDEQGNGEMSGCRYGGVEIVAIKQAQKIHGTSEQVRVDKTRDGISVGITARIP